MTSGSWALIPTALSSTSGVVRVTSARRVWKESRVCPFHRKTRCTARAARCTSTGYEGAPAPLQYPGFPLGKNTTRPRCHHRVHPARGTSGVLLGEHAADQHARCAQRRRVCPLRQSLCVGRAFGVTGGCRSHQGHPGGGRRNPVVSAAAFWLGKIFRKSWVSGRRASTP